MHLPFEAFMCPQWLCAVTPQALVGICIMAESSMLPSHILLSTWDIWCRNRRTLAIGILERITRGRVWSYLHVSKNKQIPVPLYPYHCLWLSMCSLVSGPSAWAQLPSTLASWRPWILTFSPHSFLWKLTSYQANKFPIYILSNWRWPALAIAFRQHLVKIKSSLWALTSYEIGWVAPPLWASAMLVEKRR